MSTPTYTPTVGDAILALAARDGVPGAGFREADMDFGHGLAARYRAGLPVSGAHERAGLRMLAHYREPLAAAHIDLDALTAPEPEPQQPPAEAPAAASRIAVRGGRIFTSTPWSLKEAMSAIAGGSWHKSAKCRQCSRVTPSGNARVPNCPFPALDGWHYPATSFAAVAVHEAAAPLGYRADRAFEALLADAVSVTEAAGLRSAEDLPPIPGLVTTAWKHQRQAYWFATALSGALLDMEMGTGKSLVAVGLMRAKVKRAAIIVCPERVVGVWPKQMRLHAGEGAFHAIDGRKVNRAGRTTFMPVAERVAAFDHALHECTCGRPHVVIANYAISGYEPFASWALDQQWDAAIFDEIHKIKSPTGKWSRWCAKLGEAASYRTGLTGTLMPHSPLDVFAPVRALDASLLGTSWTKFRARTVQMGGYGGHEIMGFLPGAEHKLAEQVSKITYRVGAEVLDLPDEVPDVTLECELSSKARKVYGQVESEMYAEIRAQLASGATFERAITADNVLVKLLRLQQITGGAVRTDEGDDLEIDDAKEKLLADALADIDPSKPVIVFAKFRHDLDVIERVAKELGRTYAELSGRRDDALTAEATLESGVQVAGVQLQAGGTGIDFTASHYAVYYSMGYSLGDYLQSRKRLQRPGQKESVRFIHLTVTDSIDGDVYDALAKRQQVAAYVGGLIRARQEGREAPEDVEPDIAPNLLDEAVADALHLMGGF